jgi:hypothetical protein
MPSPVRVSHLFSGLIALQAICAVGCAKADVATTPSAAGSEGSDCWVSLVRTLDGAPSSQQACAAGLTCDYAGATPDGKGHCKKP